VPGGGGGCHLCGSPHPLPGHRGSGGSAPPPFTFASSPTLPPSIATPRPRSGGRKLFKKTRHLPPQPSEQGSPGPGGDGTHEVPAHLEQFTAPEAFRFHLLPGCGSAIYESPVTGGEGTMSCYIGFGASSMGSEVPLSLLGATPSGAGQGPDPAPVAGDSDAPEEPVRPPPAADPGGWVGAEVVVALVGDSAPPDARPASEGPELSGDRLEEESVSVEDTGVCLASACSEAGDDPMPPTEGPLIPAGELLAFLLELRDRQERVQLALGRWPGVALLVRSARALSQEVSERDEELQRRIQGFLTGLEEEQSGASCAAAPSPPT